MRVKEGPGAQYKRYFDLMVLQGNCYTLDELFDRVKSARQMSAWMEYLRVRDEEEVAKYKALFGEHK
jgi:hypothetical protein